MPCPVARRAPRAGQWPRPWPGEGRPGGRGGGADPPSEAPQPSSLGITTNTSGWDLSCGPPRNKESFGRGSVSTLYNPLPWTEHLLRHRSRFRALSGWDWRKTGNRFLWGPTFPVPGFSAAPGFGNWGGWGMPL